MRERALSILLLLICVYLNSGIPLTTAQARSDHEIILGTVNNDIAMDMVVDSAGSVIVVGRSEISQDPSFGMFYAVKVSSTGETLWTKLWNITQSDILTGVTVDSEDNILMIGVSNLTTNQKYGVIYKFDSTGTELWSVQIDNIHYIHDIWYYLHSLPHSLDIHMYPDSDDFFVAGSIDDGEYKTFVARYNESGSLVWHTNWCGPPEYAGSITNMMWLSAQNWTIIAGQLSEGLDSYPQFDRPFLAAFDFSGLLVWNYTTGDHSAAFEFDSNEYIYATYVGRAYDHIVRRTYDFNETWNFDMIIDDSHSVVVSGFLANGSDNLIGYGEVITLNAGRAVIKSFNPAYSGFQPPQTLIFSFTTDGQLLWYDYLVLGRISSPCGSQFDSENRLIIAGHTSVWDFDTCDFYIVFGFVPTPFPIHNDNLAIFIFPIFNLLALCSIGGLEVIRSRQPRLPSTAPSRFTLWNAATVLFIGELALYIALYETIVGLWYSVIPPPIVYLPSWVGFTISGIFYSLAIPAFVCLIIWFRRKRNKS